MPASLSAKLVRCLPSQIGVRKLSRCASVAFAEMTEVATQCMPKQMPVEAHSRLSNSQHAAKHLQALPLTPVLLRDNEAAKPFLEQGTQPLFGPCRIAIYVCRMNGQDLLRDLFSFSQEP